MFQNSIGSAKGGLPGVWPDFLASDFKFICNPPTADKIGFELGLFFGLLNNRFFCNPLLKLSLHSFELFGDWV